LSLSLRLNVPSHSDGGTVGILFKTPIDEDRRPRRASSWPITHSPNCSTLMSDRTIPLPFGHQGLPTHEMTTSNAAKWIRSPDALLRSQIEPCRQERRLSLLPASPLPRLHQRGDFPHTKRSVPDRPMLRTPPGHREDSLPRVGCQVNWIHGSATCDCPCCRVVAFHWNLKR